MKVKLIVFSLAILFVTPVFAELTEETVPPFVVINNKVPLIVDKAITSYFRTKLAQNKTLSKYKMNVKTEDGILALYGNINSDNDANELIELAASIPGVREVDTSLLTTINSKKRFNDLAITAKINGAFLREQLYGNADITVATIGVETKNGIVFLTGHAISPDQAHTAKKIAESVLGVEWVASAIEVESS